MRILTIVHGYPPVHNAGAEWMVHEMMKYMISKGHAVKVLLKGTKDYTFEGVHIIGSLKDDNSDVIISHLKCSGYALNRAEHYKKPYIEIVHNSNMMDILRAKHKDKNAGQFIHVVYNSEFTRKENMYPNPGMVCHPHVDLKRYKTKRGDKITLINLFERKGGKFFGELARLMPEYKFLGVEGAYGTQENINELNVSIIKNTPDAKDIYAKTRILLMPSMYESYGRTGIEAMASGIPVIAAPTPGLQEALGDAAIYCKLESPLKWIEAIHALDDPSYYKEVSERSVKRAKEVEQQTLKELQMFDEYLNSIL